MSREVLLVVGKTGYGKSYWLQKFLSRKSRIFIFDPLGNYPADYTDADGLLAFYDTPDDEKKTEFCIGITNPDDIELLARIAYITGDCWLVLEEISTVFQRGENLPEWARDVIFLGRHRNINIAMTAQRAATAPIALRSQISRLVTFAQHEPDDIKYLASVIGRDAADELPDLPFYTCFDHWPKLPTALARYSA